jgi:hypothetical protein
MLSFSSFKPRAMTVVMLNSYEQFDKCP